MLTIPYYISTQTGTNQIIFVCDKKKIEFLVFNDEITDGYLKCFHFVCRLHRYGNSSTIKWCWSMLLNLINVGRSQGEKRNKKRFFVMRLVPTLLVYISTIDYSYFVPIKWISLITQHFDWLEHSKMCV